VGAYLDECGWICKKEENLKVEKKEMVFKFAQKVNMETCIYCHEEANIITLKEKSTIHHRNTGEGPTQQMLIGALTYRWTFADECLDRRGRRYKGGIVVRDA
jgi:hypothetical protein